MTVARRLTRTECVVSAYVHARDVVIDAGYHWEIRWQEGRHLQNVNLVEFLSQYTWVVLSAGMKETVIRNKFPEILRVLNAFHDVGKLLKRAKSYRTKVLQLFGNVRKVDAIFETLNMIDAVGFQIIQESLREHGVDYLRSFPFMGPATSYHLAKNLGLDVVKPDRHLLRLAAAARYDSPSAMCEAISGYVGERLAVIDLVLWRYATLRHDYVDQLLSFIDGRYLQNLRCKSAA